MLIPTGTTACSAVPYQHYPLPLPTADRYRSPLSLFSIGTTSLQRNYLQVLFPYSALPYRYYPPQRGYPRYHSPTALLSPGAVPPQRHSQEASFPMALMPTGTGPPWCHVLQVPCSVPLLPPGIFSPHCSLPFRHCCFNGATSSRYHVLQRCSLQIPLPCGAASSRHHCFVVCSFFTVQLFG